MIVRHAYGFGVGENFEVIEARSETEARRERLRRQRASRGYSDPQYEESYSNPDIPDIILEGRSPSFRDSLKDSFQAITLDPLERTGTVLQQTGRGIREVSDVGGAMLDSPTNPIKGGIDYLKDKKREEREEAGKDLLGATAEKKSNQLTARGEILERDIKDYGRKWNRYLTDDGTGNLQFTGSDSQYKSYLRHTSGLNTRSKNYDSSLDQFRGQLSDSGLIAIAPPPAINIATNPASTSKIQRDISDVTAWGGKFKAGSPIRVLGDVVGGGFEIAGTAIKPSNIEKAIGATYDIGKQIGSIKDAQRISNELNQAVSAGVSYEVERKKTQFKEDPTAFATETGIDAFLIGGGVLATKTGRANLREAGKNKPIKNFLDKYLKTETKVNVQRDLGATVRKNIRRKNVITIGETDYTLSKLLGVTRNKGAFPSSGVKLNILDTPKKVGAKVQTDPIKAIVTEETSLFGLPIQTKVTSFSGRTTTRGVGNLFEADALLTPNKAVLRRFFDTTGKEVKPSFRKIKTKTSGKVGKISDTDFFSITDTERVWGSKRVAEKIGSTKGFTEDVFFIKRTPNAKPNQIIKDLTQARAKGYPAYKELDEVFLSQQALTRSSRKGFGVKGRTGKAKAGDLNIFQTRVYKKKVKPLDSDITIMGDLPSQAFGIDDFMKIKPKGKKKPRNFFQEVYGKDPTPLSGSPMKVKYSLQKEKDLFYLNLEKGSFLKPSKKVKKRKKPKKSVRERNIFGGAGDSKSLFANSNQASLFDLTPASPQPLAMSGLTSSKVGASAMQPVISSQLGKLKSSFKLDQFINPKRGGIEGSLMLQTKQKGRQKEKNRLKEFGKIGSILGTGMRISTKTKEKLFEGTKRKGKYKQRSKPIQDLQLKGLGLTGFAPTPRPRRTPQAPKPPKLKIPKIPYIPFKFDRDLKDRKKKKKKKKGLGSRYSPSLLGLIEGKIIKTPTSKKVTGVFPRYARSSGTLRRFRKVWK